MASHSSILAWRIPWAEEPGELQPMGVTKNPTQPTLSLFKQQSEPASRAYQGLVLRGPCAGSDALLS